MFAYLCLLFTLFSGTLLANNQKQDAVQKYGTGWVVAPYYVVTNNHVVMESDQVTLFKTDRTSLNATVIVRDVVNDIALLKVNNPVQLPPAIPLAPHAPSMGERVFTIGYPHPDVMGTNPKLTVGIINSLTGMANDPRTLQISTPLQAGNSGGPLLNMNGEAIGIVTSKLNAMKMFKWTGDVPQNVNYAVKLNYLHALIDSAHKSSQPALQVLPRKKGNLVSLSQQIQNSIVLIKSGSVAVEKPGIERAKASQKPKQPTTKEAKRLAIFVYMERGDYEILDDLDDAATYSRNTASVIDSILKNNQAEPIMVTHLQHNADAKWRYYDLFKAKDGQRLCTQYNVDYLLAVRNSYDTIIYAQEDLEFVLQDCSTNRYLQYSYIITYKLQDGFDYETDIRTAARNFLSEYLNAH